MRVWHFVFVAMTFATANFPAPSSGQGKPPEKKTDDTAPSDHDRIKGLWNPVKIEGGKNPPPPDVAAEIASKIKFRFAEGKVIVHQDKEIEPEGNYTLNPAKTPKEIDIQPAKNGPTMRGIYRFDHDRLVLRLTDSEARPKDLDSELSKDELRIILMRVK